MTAETPTVKCPHCGAGLSYMTYDRAARTVYRFGKAATMTRREFSLFELVANANGTQIKLEVTGLTTRGAARVLAHHINAKLKPLGMHLDSHYGNGYGLAVLSEPIQ